METMFFLFFSPSSLHLLFEQLFMKNNIARNADTAFKASAVNNFRRSIFCRPSKNISVCLLNGETNPCQEEARDVLRVDLVASCVLGERKTEML